MSEANSFDKKKYGYVFNIQHYSVHDGPGIRTLVFLKGCPLKCIWCSNPESQHYYPELAYNKNKCIEDECGFCLKVCPTGAIDGTGADGKISINRLLCDSCFKCADVCPSKALNVFGKLMSVDEVLDTVEKDSIFYSRSGGGLTLSGGEALMQAEFTAELLKEAKRRRINTSIETCGYTDWGNIAKACENLDTIFYDIKCINSSKHRIYTGMPNEKILDNLKKLCAQFPNIDIIVRTPVVPGFNDTKEDILSIIEFIKDFPGIQYELLAYHRLGEQKYEYIGKDYTLSGISGLDEDHFASLKKLAKSKSNIKIL